MINAEGKTYAFFSVIVSDSHNSNNKCMNKSHYCTLLSRLTKYVRDVFGISNLADEDNDELNNTDMSDEELDESGDKVKDQEKEGKNSATDDNDDNNDDDDDDDMENNEEESSEDDNGSDLESEGEKYNVLQCFKSVLSISLFFSW